MTPRCPFCLSQDHTEACPVSTYTWPPPMTKALFVTRVCIFVSMCAGLFLWYCELPYPWPVIAVLSVSTALLIVGVLVALEGIPAEVAGKVTGRRR